LFTTNREYRDSDLNTIRHRLAHSTTISTQSDKDLPRHRADVTKYR